MAAKKAKEVFVEAEEARVVPTPDPVPQADDSHREDTVIGFDEVSGDPITAADSFQRGGAVTPDKKHPRGFKLFKMHDDSAQLKASAKRVVDRGFEPGANFDPAEDVKKRKPVDKES